MCASSSDKTNSAKKPRLDQTSRLLCPASSIIRCCCCSTSAGTLLLPNRNKLKSRPVSWSTSPPGSASSSHWTHLFASHISSVFPLLTTSVSQPALRYRTKSLDPNQICQKTALPVLSKPTVCLEPQRNGCRHKKKQKTCHDSRRLKKSETVKNEVILEMLWCLNLCRC